LKSPTKIHHSPVQISPILETPKPAKEEENEKIRSLELRLAGTIRALKETEKVGREKEEKIKVLEDELERRVKTIESLNSSLSCSKINTV